MKTFKSILLSVVLLTAFTHCDNSIDDSNFDNDLLYKQDQNKNLSAKNSETVTVPFEANFYTEKTELTEDYECPPGSTGPNHQVGEGVGTQLGKLDAVMTFCGYPGVGNYDTGTGKLIAANGDELWIAIEGVVNFIFDDPFYEAYFTDTFTFTGGTGRFEGATGGGTTNSFVDLWTNGWPIPDGPSTDFIVNHRTDHIWTGTLTFIPGSKSH